MNIIDLGLLPKELEELKSIATKYKMPTTIYANLLIEELLDDVDRLVSIEDDLLDDNEELEEDEDFEEYEEDDDDDEDFEYIEIELKDEQMHALKTFSENTKIDLFIALRYIFLESMDDENDLIGN